MTRIAFVAASLSLALIACRGGDDGGTSGDDTTDPDGPPAAGEVTIQEVQNDAMAVGTAIELRGVVVTAVDTFGDRTGDLYVEEPGGGAFSGVKVYGASLDVVATIQPGDIVDITNAIKHEACTQAAPCGSVIFDPGQGITEVEGTTAGALTITKTGTGALPPVSDVDALAISMMPEAQQIAEWEKWEGVLINVKNARQTSAYAPFSTGNPDQMQFTATGDIRVQSALADLGNPTVGTCYNGITGIGDYFFEYLVLPKQASDLVGGGTGCAAVTTTTIAAIQMGTATGSVQLSDLVITGRDEIGNSSKGIWVSDAAQAAQYNGVYVFTGSTIDATWVVGAKVDVTGTVQEFDPNNVGDKLTEIGQATITVKSGTATPLPLTVTATQVADITNGEPFEGVLVQLANLKVTNNAVGQGKVELTDNNNNKIIMDDDAFAYMANTLVNNVTCFSSLTGLMSVQLTDNIRTVNPRSATDMVVGAGCN